MQSLPIIFRAERSSSEVTAVFPTLPGTNDPRTFTVYAHIGQHGSGRKEWYRATRAATPDEYAGLLRELASIYSDCVLIIAHRFTQRHDIARRAALRGPLTH